MIPNLEEGGKGGREGRGKGEKDLNCNLKS